MEKLIFGRRGPRKRDKSEETFSKKKNQWVMPIVVCIWSIFGKLDK